MANIRVKSALDRISTEMEQVTKQVIMYSGVDKTHAWDIDNLCSSIIQSAATIAAEARKTRGDRGADKLVEKVRKTLGYTHP